MDSSAVNSENPEPVLSSFTHLQLLIDETKKESLYPTFQQDAKEQNMTAEEIIAELAKPHLYAPYYLPNATKYSAEKATTALSQLKGWVIEHDRELTTALAVGALAGTFLAFYFSSPQKLDVEFKCPQGISFKPTNKSLTLPTKRFEHTQQLSTQNVGKVWESGDFTVIGTRPDGLIFDCHTFHPTSTAFHPTSPIMTRNPLSVRFNEKELERLKDAIHNWRLDDVVKPKYVGDGTVFLTHHLTGQTFIGRKA